MSIPDAHDDPTSAPPTAVPAPPVTGDSAVDDVVAGLADAVQGPPEEQVAAFDAAHRALQDRLADVDG